MIENNVYDKIFILFGKMEADPLERSFEGSFTNPSFDWSAEELTDGPTLSSGALPAFDRDFDPSPVGQVSIPIPIRRADSSNYRPVQPPMAENRFNLTRIPSRRYSFPFSPVTEPTRRTERARDQAIGRLIQLQVSLNELEHRIHRREKYNTIVIVICIFSLYLMVIIWSFVKSN